MHLTDILGARRLGLAAGSLAFVATGVASVSPAGAALTATVAGDTLTVKGSAANDSVALRLAPGQSGTLQVDFGDDGTADASFDRSTFSSIRVTLRSGADSFRVDQVNGAFADEALTVEGEDGNDTMNGGDGAEQFFGGAGNDVADGNRGSDTGTLGSGRDSFRWDPGDGSDVVEGGLGFDTLDFNGAPGDEVMSLSANGSRSLFLRSPGDIRMDMDDVEALDLTALAGVDTVTVNDMSGTDFQLADVDLSGPAGGPDGAADVVAVNGSARGDAIAANAAGTEIEVTGLKTTTAIAGGEPADRLLIDGRAGNDTIDVDPAVNALVTVVATP